MQASSISKQQGARDVRPVGSKYLLEEPLGRGATGTVWRARQRETAGAEAAVAGQPGETVAIKVLKEELASDPDIVMRFLRERSVLLRLTHPNIVRVRDLVVEGELLALVMDLVDGPDLHRYLRENGPLTPVAASLLTAQVADALAASHRDGVVHRDLKPANVLLRQLDGEMHPMLTDFGIARLADSPGLTRTQEFVGTPAYVAPESAEGRPQTSAVDVYGAGILLYELVTGRPPFSGATSLEVLHQHLSAEARRPSTVPDPLWTVIERCLRKNPLERPSAENLARGLRVVAEGIGVHANAAQIAAAEGVGALLAPTRPRPRCRASRASSARPTPPPYCRRAPRRARTTRTAPPASCRTPRGPPVPRTPPPYCRTPARPIRRPCCRTPGRRVPGRRVPVPSSRTPGRTSCGPPGTAMSRRRSSTSPRRTIRCTTGPSGRWPARSTSRGRRRSRARSSRSSADGSRGRVSRGISRGTATRPSSLSSSLSASPSSTPRRSSPSSPSSPSSRSDPRGSPGRRGSAVPTR